MNIFWEHSNILIPRNPEQTTQPYGWDKAPTFWRWGVTFWMVAWGSAARF